MLRPPIILTIAILVIVSGILALLVVKKSTSAERDLATAAEDQSRWLSVIGDSYSEGTTQGGLEDSNWTEIVARARSWHLANVSVGGTGYVYSTPPKRPFESEQLPSAVRVKPYALIVEGSRNDGSSPPEQVHEAAEGMFRSVKALAPNTRLIVVGPIWSNDTVPRGVTDVRYAVRDAALKAGAVWIDPIAEGWFERPAGLIAEDGVHPTDEGHRVMAARIEQDLRAAGV
jgi:hypothetical protein